MSHLLLIIKKKNLPRLLTATYVQDPRHHTHITPATGRWGLMYSMTPQIYASGGWIQPLYFLSLFLKVVATKGSQSVEKGVHMLSAGLVLSSSSSSFDLFCFISLLRFSSLYNTRHYDFFMSFSYCLILHSLLIAHFFIPYHTPIIFSVGYYLLCLCLLTFI